MVRRLVLLPVLIVVSAAWGQAPKNFRPTEPLKPVALPWEYGGAEYLGPQPERDEMDNRPFPTHRIIANVYYVGTQDFAQYLITSPQGHILIDTGFESNVPQIQKNVAQLGFKFEDIKIVLITHAHFDHCGGAALIKKLTGAQVMAMEGEAEPVSNGASVGSIKMKWTPVKVDRVLQDRDQITLGGNTLTAYKGPGHTPACTGFVWNVQDGGKTYVVNLPASLSADAVALGSKPDLLDQYRFTFRVLKSLPCDVFIGGHGKFFGLHEKYARLQKGGPNPYIDPEGYKAHLQLMEANVYYKMDYATRRANLRASEVPTQTKAPGQPAVTLPPILVPWEDGGADYMLYTREMNDRPFPGHRIIANVYHVGAGDYSQFLITSPQGHILIDTGLESTVPKIQKNVEQLGFKFEDIKIVLLSHAHTDHAAGTALVKKMTGAQLWVMDGDAPYVEKGEDPPGGGPPGKTQWPAVKVDRVLHDKDQIVLGGNTLTAYKTPGHTPGSTTFLMTAQEEGKSYVVNFTASLSVNVSSLLVTDPGLLDQYRTAYKVLNSLPCDVFLSGHGKFFGMNDKYARWLTGGPNPYVDSEGYKAHVRLMEASLYYKMDWAVRQANVSR